MTTPTVPPRFTPQAFALRLIALVFGTELAVMWFLSRFPGINGWTEILIDAGLLSLGIAPILWFWLHQAERARLQAESALRDKDAEVERSLTHLNRLRLALDRHAIVAITDPEGRILEANDAFCAITGYSRGELVGKIHWLFSSRNPEDTLVGELLQTLRAGRIWHGELTNRSREGTQFWVDSTIAPFTNTAGVVETLVAIHYDITARHKQTEILRSSEVQLYEHNLALEAATARAENLAREATAATRAKAEFLANMSHEIRTPMNAVIGMADLLLDTPLAPMQREFADTIRNSSDALLALINDILDFSKIESGALRLEHIPFNLRDCVESAIDLTARPAAVKGIDLLYWIEDDVPSHALGDFTRLHQVLVNLVANAVKFTERGDVVVTLSRRPAPPGSCLAQSLLGVSVRDTGIGIPSDRVDRLFQAFSQVDASTTRKYGGTGLGLAICQRLVTLMGGRIWVESRPGEGSDFQFEIPLHPAPASPVAYRPAPVANIAGRRLLLVDDNPTNLRILALQTQRWGFLTAVASSGAAALELLDRGDPFDATIIDVQMPEMDGYTLAEEIRRRRTAAQLPILVLTSIGNDTALFDRLDVAQILTKPAKASALLNALTAIFSEDPASVDERANTVPIDSSLGSRFPLEILLAEDHPTNQRVARLLLARLGYDCQAVSTGVEALAAVAQKEFDVLLLDVQMPELDGYQTARQLCADYPPGRRPWIVAMTANALEGDRESCLAAGMDDYLAKPVGAQLLATVLTHAAEQRAPRR